MIPEIFKQINLSTVLYKKANVLIVDDNEQNILLLEGLLEDLNVNIVKALSGNEAISKTNEYEFAIALIDVQMPIMDGYETIEKIHNNARNKHLPVIFVSAIYTDDFYKIKGVQYGAVDFISKPIIPELLIGKVQIFLDLYHQQKLVEAYQNYLEQIVEQRTIKLNQKNIELEQEIIIRKETEHKLQLALKKANESERLKSAFLTNFSHEIRTPMNAIVGFSNLLNDYEIEKQQKEEYIYYIKSNASALLTLIDNIVEIAKIETGELVIEKSEIIVDDIINEIIAKAKEIMFHFDKQHLIIKNSSKNNSTKIISNRQRIYQILLNLIDNAIKFTENGYIEIGYEIKDDNSNIEKFSKNIVFYVKDTGIGIPKEMQKAIFEKFFKIEDDHSKLYRGTGIGLAIVQKLVYLLGGEISVESEPKKGSTFFFSLSVR